MSTKQTDVNNMQETPPRDTPSLYTADTVQQVKASPPGGFQPPPHHRPPRSNGSYWFAVAAVVVVVALIFSVFALVVAQQGQHPATQITPTPTSPGTTVTTTPGSDATLTPTPGVTQGPQNGPASVSDLAYWDRILGTQGTNGKVESVSFANVMGNSTLQALVTIRHSDANGTLDAYVFDKITNTSPTRIFMLTGLIKGDAQISYYNSIMTAQVDTNSALNTGKLEGALTTDLCREFKWSDGAGTFVQTAFPGFFPDMTRWQAEAAQAQANAGQNTWRNDPAQVAKLLAARLMNWQGTLTTKVLSGGGPHDVYASVQVQGTPIQSAQPPIVVTLSRLEGNTHNIWEAIGVKDGSTLTLTNIPTGSLISSPVTLTGTGSAYEAVIGQGVVYDHLYTNIGHEQLTGSPGMGRATYSINVPYSSSFTGAQEGIVVAYQDMGGLSSGYSSAVVVKVMIGG